MLLASSLGSARTRVGGLAARHALARDRDVVDRDVVVLRRRRRAASDVTRVAPLAHTMAAVARVAAINTQIPAVAIAFSRVAPLMAPAVARVTALAVVAPQTGIIAVAP